MDAIKLKEKQLLEKMDRFILTCNRDEIYKLEQDSTVTVLKKCNLTIYKTLIVCAAEREESMYMEHTIFSVVDSSLAISPTVQLSKIYDNVSRYLLRFLNDFPDEYLQEGIEYFVNNNISGDILARVSMAGKIDPEKVLTAVAVNMMQYNISVTLRIYKTLQMEYKKPEYHLAAAMIYMKLGDMKTAYNVLESVENKTTDIENILDEIKSQI